MKNRAAPDHIPVLKPLLPSASLIIPYLEKIDAARCYSNFGPLEALFRHQLAAMANLDAMQVALFSSGTAALTLALRATCGERRGLCIVPAWTHIGTAAAITAAGLTPTFIDCDAATWAITPNAEIFSGLDVEDIVAVIPVAPFGAHVDYAAWDHFSHKHDIAVVIDGAAGFDQFVDQGGETAWGRTPVMVSLHATKIFGVGEGGLLLSGDADLIATCVKIGNFGIYGDEPVASAFGNAKMSEYSAAVGLAFLHIWAERRVHVRELTAAMKRRLDDVGAITAPGFGSRFVSSSCMIAMPGISGASLIERLARKNIHTRQWWRNGLHKLPEFHSNGSTDLALESTDGIAASFVGIPFFPGLDEPSLERIVLAISQP